VWDKLTNYIGSSGPCILDAIKQAFTGALDWLKGQFGKAWEELFGLKSAYGATPAAPA
jgi:hypothetical protein